MSTELGRKKCGPCEHGVALKGEALRPLRAQLNPAWELVDEHHLQREFSFRNFREALDFTNRVGDLAESEGHHPDIFLAWGKVGIKLWTHSVGGLSENDFILAAKVDELCGQPAGSAGR